MHPCNGSRRSNGVEIEYQFPRMTCTRPKFARECFHLFIDRRIAASAKKIPLDNETVFYPSRSRVFSMTRKYVNLPHPKFPNSAVTDRRSPYVGLAIDASHLYIMQESLQRSRCLLIELG